MAIKLKVVMLQSGNACVYESKGLIQPMHTPDHRYCRTSTTVMGITLCFAVGTDESVAGKIKKMIIGVV